jgi:hypothetical protein
VSPSDEPAALVPLDDTDEAALRRERLSAAERSSRDGRWPRLRSARIRANRA